MQKKGYSILAILLCLLFVLPGCAKSESVPVATYAPDPIVETEPEIVTVTEEQEPINEINNNDDYKQEVIKNTAMYDLWHSDNISIASTIFTQNGVAWAFITPETSEADSLIALINKRGEAIYVDSAKNIWDEDNALAVTVSPFINGKSVYYIKDKPGFVIVDEYGKVLYYSDPKDNMYMIGQADDGRYLMLKYTEASFSSEESYMLCTLNLDLSLEDTGIAIDTEYIRLDLVEDVIFLSDNYYCIRGGYTCNSTYINLEDKTVYYSWDSLVSYLDGIAVIARYYYSGDYVMASADVLKREYVGEHVYEGDKDKLINNPDVVILRRNINEGVLLESISEFQREKLPRYNVAMFPPVYTSFNDGSFLRIEGYTDNIYCADYVNYQGNIIFSYPTLPDGTKYNQIKPFKDGWKYSAVELIGVDKKNYTTIVNTNGEFVYDPIVFKYYDAYDGFILGYNEEESATMILTPQGELKRLGEKIEGLEDVRYYNQRCIFSIGQNYLFLSDQNNHYYTCYYSLEDGKEISKIELNTDSDGYIVYKSDEGKSITNKDSRININ